MATSLSKLTRFTGTLSNATDGYFGASTNDYIFGTSNNDTITGGAASVAYSSDGNDTLEGGVGDDVYIVNDALDSVVENAGEGNDTIFTSVTYILPANVENIAEGKTNSARLLTGNALDNILDGSLTASNAASGDTLVGLAGNDTYYPGLSTNASAIVDTVSELNGSLDATGTDTIVAPDKTVSIDISTASVTASATKVGISGGLFIENAVLTGSGQATGSGATLTGNALANRLIGNGDDNFITGNAGNDFLDGGVDTSSTVADTLVGGAGDDTYIVRVSDETTGESVDKVNETVAGSAGTDTVRTYATYTLPTNVENLVLMSAKNPTTLTTLSGTGNSLNNLITGNGDSNTLTGAAGNDTLNGAGGADSLVGGAGNDIYLVDDLLDVVTEKTSEGTDLVQSSVTFTLGSNVENLTLTGTSAINGTGNALNNTIVGNAATDTVDSNVLTGFLGNDSIAGSSGKDTLDGGLGNDTLDGGTGNDAMAGGYGTDIYYANVSSTADTVTEVDASAGGIAVQVTAANTAATAATSGASGINAVNTGLATATTGLNATIAATTGALSGVSAGVTAVVNSATAAATNAATQIGTANTNANNAATLITAEATAATTYAGATTASNLTAHNSAATSASTAENTAVSSMSNALTSAITAQTLVNAAVAANAVSPVGALTTALTNLKTATDAVVTSLTAASSLTATTSYQLSVLQASVAAAALDVAGTSGTTQTDIVNFTGTTGTFTLGANIETLVLTGTSAINGTGNSIANSITGNGAANNLDGAAGNDTLSGGAGIDSLTGGTNNDRLDGGVGDDTLNGGTGNDVYVVSSLTDTITEVASGGGTDTLESSITYTLSDAGTLNNLVLTTAIENLTLTGTAITGEGNALDNVIIGNTGANGLYSLGGNDTLNGGTGADTMAGGSGNDLYIVDNANDVLFEAASTAPGSTISGGTGGSSDTVQLSVTRDFSGYTGNNADLDTFILSAGSAISITGTSIANTITGNSAANTLSGASGNDTLNGGAGNDSLSGGASNDTLNENEASTVSVTYYGATSATIITASGNDTLNGDAGNDIINAGIGNDIITGGTEKDTVTVGAGSDTIKFNINEAVDTFSDGAATTIDLYSDLTLNAATADKIDLSVAVVTLGGGVTDSFTGTPTALDGNNTTFANYLNRALSVAGGNGFQTNIDGGVSAAVVHDSTNNKDYLAVDLNGSDTFNYNVADLAGSDFVIEITGSDTTGLTTASFM